MFGLKLSYNIKLMHIKRIKNDDCVLQETVANDLLFSSLKR